MVNLTYPLTPIQEIQGLYRDFESKALEADEKTAAIEPLHDRFELCKDDPKFQYDFSHRFCEWKAAKRSAQIAMKKASQKMARYIVEGGSLKEVERITKIGQIAFKNASNFQQKFINELLLEKRVYEISFNFRAPTNTDNKLMGHQF